MRILKSKSKFIKNIYIDLKFVALKNWQIELNADFGWLELEVLQTLVTFIS